MDSTKYRHGKAITHVVRVHVRVRKNAQATLRVGVHVGEEGHTVRVTPSTVVMATLAGAALSVALRRRWCM